MKPVFLKTNKFGSRPWIFRKMVERPEGVEDGEIVEVYDPEKRFVGHGFYNSKPQIALRLLDRGPRKEVGVPFLRQKLREAIYLRRRVLDLDRRTDAYRVVNAEGDGFPGLVVDRYGRYLVLSFYCLGAWRIGPELRAILAEEFDGAHTILRVDGAAARREGFQAAVPESEASTVVTENGVRFRVDFRTGHKTGFFCDQRENRLLLTASCRDRNVLDGCCYTGGFSLYAKTLGRAGKVVGVDLDEDAVAVARENARENQASVEFVHANIFDFLRAERAKKAHWDVIVLDPPKLASAKADLERAEKTYKDLNFEAMSSVKNGGLLLTCSCSGLVSEEMFLAILRKAAARAGRTLQILQVSGAGPDHPVMPNFPESKYLKAVLCSVRKG